MLCDADRITVNAHAFYDGNVVSGNAGNFILNTVLPNIRSACAPYAAVNNIIITESGWPSRGGGNGAAVASTGDEQSALSNLNCAARSVGIMAFESEDSLWKNANDNEKSTYFVPRGVTCADTIHRLWNYRKIWSELGHGFLRLLNLCYYHYIFMSV